MYCTHTQVPESFVDRLVQCSWWQRHAVGPTLPLMLLALLTVEERLLGGVVRSVATVAGGRRHLLCICGIPVSLSDIHGTTSLPVV